MMMANKMNEADRVDLLLHSSLAVQSVAAAGDVIKVGELASSVESVRGRRRRRRANRNRGSKARDDEVVGMMRRNKLTAEQSNRLEMSFCDERKLESERKNKLASELGLNPRQVAVWFQNRRARWKYKRIEEEYSKLKTAHEGAISEKCQLETQVLRLQELLLQAEKEKQRLAERVEQRVVCSSTSTNPCSSFSMEVGPPLLGELALGRCESVFDLCEKNYIQEIEWVNLYGYGL